MARLISVISASPPGANASHRAGNGKPVAASTPKAAATARASMKHVAPALTISTFSTRITGMLTNRQPIEVPITTCARLTLSAGGLASVTPLR